MHLTRHLRFQSMPMSSAYLIVHHTNYLGNAVSITSNLHIVSWAPSSRARNTYKRNYDEKVIQCQRSPFDTPSHQSTYHSQCRQYQGQYRDDEQRHAPRIFPLEHPFPQNHIDVDSCQAGALQFKGYTTSDYFKNAASNERSILASRAENWRR